MHARTAILATVIAVAAPLAVASGASAQAVAVHRLTVKITATSSASITVLDLADGSVRHLSGNGTLDLGAGTYNVAAWFGLGSQTVTLADQVVDLDRNRTVTLSAAGGVGVSVSVDNPAAQEESLELAPFAGRYWATPTNPAGSLPTAPVPSLPVDHTYIVPMTSKLVTLYVYSVWQRAGSSAADPSPYRYDIVQAFHDGFPSTPNISAKTSQFARVDVTARAFDADQQASLNLDPLPQQVGAEPLTATTALGGTPAHLVSYRSPGFRWQSLMFWQSPSTVPHAANELEEYNTSEPLYQLGRYTETWGQAVFAPQPDTVQVERAAPYLLAGLFGSPWADPFHAADGAEFQKLTLRLYSGGKLAGEQRGPQIKIRLPRKATTCTLIATATRLPGAGLSSLVTGTWQFTAGGSVVMSRILSVTIAAGGLNDANQAPAGSQTAITLGIFSRPEWLTYPISSVRAWASANNGATWQLASVRKVHGRYVVYVRNAKAAGYTSLRVYVADNHGNSEKLTVIDAYGVS